MGLGKPSVQMFRFRGWWMHGSVQIYAENWMVPNMPEISNSTFIDSSGNTTYNTCI